MQRADNSNNNLGFRLGDVFYVTGRLQATTIGTAEDCSRRDTWTHRAKGSPGTDLQIHDYLTDVKSTLEERTILPVNGVEPAKGEDCHRKRDEPHTKPTPDVGSKTTELLEDTMRDYLHDLRVDKHFLNETQKTVPQNERIDMLGSIIVDNSC